MTLLLGPPGAGKTTLLTTLAGKPDHNLKVTGTVTYSGHSLNEFVPQITSSYISQHDLHLHEMTVRETLDFSGHCQGVGARYEMMQELSRCEKKAGIKPDLDVDVFMKETAIEGQQTNFVMDYVLTIILQKLRLMEYECFRFFRRTDYSHRLQCLWFLPDSGLRHLCKHNGWRLDAPWNLLGPEEESYHRGNRNDHVFKHENASPDC